MAIRQLVLAGLPTTSTCTSSAACVGQRLALGGEDGAVGREQVAPLHARRAGPGADEQGVVDVAEGAVGVVGLHDAAEQRERAVVELHHHALSSVEGRGDLQQVEDDRLVGAEHAPLAMRNSRP